MATRGRKGRFEFGHVTERIVKHSPAPVPLKKAGNPAFFVTKYIKLLMFNVAQERAYYPSLLEARKLRKLLHYRYHHQLNF